MNLRNKGVTESQRYGIWEHSFAGITELQFNGETDNGPRY